MLLRYGAITFTIWIMYFYFIFYLILEYN